MTAIKQPVPETKESSKACLAKDESAKAFDILAYYGADILFKKKGDTSYSKAPITSNSDREDIREFISNPLITEIQLTFKPDFDL